MVAPSPFANLPDETLKHILSYVPLKQRLSSCALVSRQWQAAATAATECLEMRTRLQPERAACCKAWVLAHGSSLTNLRLIGVKDLTQLPCSRLRRLELESCCVLLSAHGGQPGVLAGCSALTGLILRFGTYLGVQDKSKSYLDGLTALKGLQELDLQSCSAPLSKVFARLDSCLWASLVHLTRLALSDAVDFNPQSLQHISKLTVLRDLNLKFPRGQAVFLGDSRNPAVALPVSLRQMHLSGARLRAPVLHHLTGLSRLHVQSCGVLAPAPDTQALMSLPAQLSSLQDFECSDLRLAWPASPAPFSALFSSTSLQRLVVRNCGAPDRFWERAFLQLGGAASLPQLRHLSMFQDNERSDVASTDWDLDTFPGSLHATRAVTSACPALESLQLAWPDVDEGQQVSAALAQLSALTELTVCCHQLYGLEEDQSCMRSIAATLTRLVRLELSYFNSDEESMARVLLPLTALRQLESLTVEGAPETPCFPSKEFPGPVWSGLLKWCNNDGGWYCQNVIVDQLLAQQQRLEAAVREAQAAAAQAEATAAQAHAEAAAARAEAEQLRAQLQASQGPKQGQVKQRRARQ